MAHQASPQLYGMGNALLDREFQVTEEQLTALGLDKGLMTLIDAERYQQLCQQLDSTAAQSASGGSVANSMVTASQLGVSSFMACRVAEDESGQHYARSLERAQVGARIANTARPNGHTGACLAFITPDGERTMLSYLGVSADFGCDDLDLGQLKQARMLYIEGYLIASTVSMQAVLYAMKIAKQAGVKIALSLSDVNMVKHFREQLDAILEQGIDIVFANDQEAHVYSGSQELPQQVAALGQYCQHVLITHGKRGASYAACGQATITLPAAPVKMIDTLGAGDAFAGTFLAAWLQGQSADVCLQQAIFIAGHIVAKSGPRFTQQEIETFMQQLPRVVRQVESVE